jgi:hypothetical protein
VSEDKLAILKQQPIAGWDYPRIVIAIPMERTLAHADDVFYHFWAIAQQGIPIMRLPYNRTDITRNKMAVELLKSDFTHVLMLDSDHKHPWDIVQKLARWVLVKDDVQVVGGLNFRRNQPYDPCCGYLGNDGKYYPPAKWDDGLVKMDIVGTGSILIAREVFELIPPPWFYNDYSRVWADKWPGEDLGFSRLCKKYGVDMYVDTTVTSPHMQDAMVTEDTFRRFIEANNYEIGSYEEFVERIKQEA